MRSIHSICKAISESTDEERGDMIRRIRDFDWTPERKASITKFIMMLGFVGGASKKQ